MARYYPVNLELANRKCLVIGAGSVALRKVKRLLESGARVLVVGPSVAPGLKAMAEKKRIRLKKRKANLADLKGAYLVIAAASDRKINSLASSYCRNKNILINVVDSPKECNFILPSIVRRGALSIGISTEGISPALARKIREDLQKRFGAEYARLLRIMKEIRPRAIKNIKNSRSRKIFFKQALQPEIFDLVRRNKTREARRRLEGILKHAIAIS